MIRRKSSGQYQGVEIESYKNEPGTWMNVTRQTLFKTSASKFEGRVFHLSPGGYSSYEKHEHEHCVLVLSGSGRVRIGEDWHEIQQGDFVHVQPWTPHQFTAGEDSELEILCVVDQDRDRPILLGNATQEETSDQ